MGGGLRLRREGQRSASAYEPAGCVPHEPTSALRVHCFGEAKEPISGCALVDNPRPSQDHSPTVSRSATIILAAALALGPMRHGSCEHCDTPVKPSCHGAGGSGEHHAAGRHGPPSGERAPSCPCPAHNLCGVPHADQTALSASLTPHASFSGGGVTLVVAVDAPSGSLRGNFRYPGGRASPSPHRPPLYLVTHSLLI